jgi:hypothetical protein
VGEIRVPYAQHFVEHEQIRRDRRRGGKHQADAHPGRVRLHRLVDVLLDLGKREDFVEEAGGSRAGDPLMGEETNKMLEDMRRNPTTSAKPPRLDMAKYHNLPEKYGDPKRSDLEIDVHPGPNDFDINLK